ncbi:MAG: hypothetical protein KAY24_00220 [Candidatus Eisenbacteria sp.]|nr:hypothetical protein [Candidatus Eisenbacteria bacterium]
MAEVKRKLSWPDYIYAPDQAMFVARKEIKDRAQTGAFVEWGIEPLDEYLVPLRPGELCTVIGRPGHGKTSICVHLALHAADVAAEDEWIVFATWETRVEELVCLLAVEATGCTLEDIGRGKADPVEFAASCWNEGIGYAWKNVLPFGRGAMSPEYVPSLRELDEALHGIKEKFNVRLVICDYLQRIPEWGKLTGWGKDRVAIVSANLEILKSLALRHNVTVVAPVQAGRQVDDLRGLKIPRIGDGQWTSVIEQTSDEVLAITKPGLYMAGEYVDLGDCGTEADDKLFVVKVLKRRWGRAGRSFALDFDPYKMRFASRELDF